MENLPLEITENILSRLPVVSKSQAREVCKTWQNLIPKPKRGLLYGVSHRKATNLEAQFYFLEQNIEKVDDNCFGTFTKLDHNMTIPSSYLIKTFMVGSCHGLVCYAVYAGYVTSNTLNKITINICNPFTGENIQLPTAYSRADFSEKAIGFGYDHSSNEYKVVRILLDGNIMVYTLQGGTAWRNSKSLSTSAVKKCFTPHLGRVAQTPSVGAVAGGAIHWLDENATAILAFDLEHETLSLIPSIPFDFCNTIVGLMVLGGDLCVLQVALGKHFNIWELSNRKTVRYSLRYSPKRSPWLTKFSIVCKDWSGLERFDIPKNDEYFLWYNVVLSCFDPETKTLRKLEQTLKKLLEDGTPSVYTTTQATPFMHSLISLKANMEQRVGKKRKAP